MLGLKIVFLHTLGKKAIAFACSFVDIEVLTHSDVYAENEMFGSKFPGQGYYIVFLGKILYCPPRWGEEGGRRSEWPCGGGIEILQV